VRDYAAGGFLFELNQTASIVKRKSEIVAGADFSDRKNCVLDGGSLQAAVLFGGDHELDLLEFGALDAKEGGHLNDLFGTDEIVGVGTETCEAGAELAATHRLWNVEAEPALALLIIQTEFADRHNV